MIACGCAVCVSPDPRNKRTRASIHVVMDGLHTADVSGLLGSVEAPTLVLQREKRGTDIARRLAAGIPNAHVVIFDGTSAAPYLPDAEEIWDEIARFIGIDSVSAFE